MEMAGFREEVFRRSAASFGVDRRDFECNALIATFDRLFPAWKIEIRNGERTIGVFC